MKYYPKFEQEEFTVASLIKIPPHDLNELIPLKGPRIELLEWIVNKRKELGMPVDMYEPQPSKSGNTTQQSTDSSSSSPFPSSSSPIFNESSLRESLSLHCSRLFTCAPPSDEWQLDGQVVCILDPRIFITAAHCCFYVPDSKEAEEQGNLKRKQKPLLLSIYYRTKGGKNVLFPAQLIRYSASMDIAMLMIHHPSSPFSPIPLFNPSNNFPSLGFGSFCYIVSYPLKDEKKQQSSLSRRFRFGTHTNN